MLRALLRCSDATARRLFELREKQARDHAEAQALLLKEYTALTADTQHLSESREDLERKQWAIQQVRHTTRPRPLQSRSSPASLSSDSGLRPLPMCRSSCVSARPRSLRPRSLAAVSGLPSLPLLLTAA